MTAPCLSLITLDLDDTLWPCAPIIRSAEEGLFDWLRRHAPRLAERHDIASLQRHRQTIMAESPQIAHDLGLVRRRSLSELLAAHDYATELADAAMTVFLTYRNQVTPYPEVRPALERLAARYCLVSITNGNADVESTPLRGLFHHNLTAALAGAAKPDRAIFDQALTLAGCAPHQCLHLGDDPWTDVQAARDAGLGAVWINRDARAWPDELTPPCLRVTNLDQFVTWLDGAATGETDGV